MNLNMLEDIPDPQSDSLDALLAWVQSRIDAVHHTDFTPEILKSFAPVELKEDISHSCGAEGSATWRRFFLATLVADWVSYDRPVDRADFARLKYIMTSAYPNTRVWGCRFSDGKFTPVGYTAWYPISKFIYDGIINNQRELDDRGMILPARFADTENIRYAYIFNFSIAKELHHTLCSKRLISAFLSDKAFKQHIGALMITVTPEGRKFAERARFVSVGEITVEGETENLYVRHPIT